MDWAEVLIPITIFGCAVLIVKIVTDYKLRKQLVEKGEVSENVKYLFSGYSDKVKMRSNLKWGLILVGIGVAMLLKQISPFYISDESILGLVFLFGGIGFLAYFYVASKDSNNSNAGPQNQ